MTRAEQSIMERIFVVRDALAPIVPDFSSTEPREDGWFVDPSGRKVWSYDRARTAIVLAEPIVAGDMARVLPTYKTVTPSEQIVGEVSLFARTAKMNCYSWNLPAGPPSVGGTCPGARFSFQVEPIAPLAAIEVSKSFAPKSMRGLVPESGSESVRRFVCNGCYALKNNYQFESVIATQMVKHAWLLGYALVPRGKTVPFVEAMVKGIQSTQQRSEDRPVPTQLAARAKWTHPDFFRIHDSGDFFSERYLQAWIEICRRLPSVNFWAPTRIWADKEMLGALRRAIRAGIPSNLAIRPSGLFFDGPQPVVRDVSAGSSSTHFAYLDRPEGVEVVIEHAGRDAWGCPAYLPSSMGGGARPKRRKDLKENPQLLRRMPMLQDDSDPDGVFYPAVVDSSGQYVTDPKTGAPLSVRRAEDYVFDESWRIAGRRAKGERKTQVPEQNVRMAQAYQPAGCCSIAMDPRGNEECRVCWGVSGMRRDDEMTRLPVVYAEH